LVAYERLVMMMSNLKRRMIFPVVTGVAALAFLVAPSALLVAQGSDNPSAQCYNGVTRLDPYGRSCTIPGPTNKIRGSAPDANAIIACRGIPGCLSWYVNNP
jgi:hypothetical protein